jgi:hypothetical protein
VKSPIPRNPGSEIIFAGKQYLNSDFLDAGDWRDF